MANIWDEISSEISKIINSEIEKEIERFTKRFNIDESICRNFSPNKPFILLRKFIRIGIQISDLLFAKVEILLLNHDPLKNAISLDTSNFSISSIEEITIQKLKQKFGGDHEIRFYGSPTILLRTQQDYIQVDCEYVYSPIVLDESELNEFWNEFKNEIASEVIPRCTKILPEIEKEISRFSKKFRFHPSLLRIIDISFDSQPWILIEKLFPLSTRAGRFFVNVLNFAPAGDRFECNDYKLPDLVEIVKEAIQKEFGGTVIVYPHRGYLKFIAPGIVGDSDSIEFFRIIAYKSGEKK